jgi:hypothetical protein
MEVMAGKRAVVGASMTENASGRLGEWMTGEVRGAVRVNGKHAVKC